MTTEAGKRLLAAVHGEHAVADDGIPFWEHIAAIEAEVSVIMPTETRVWERLDALAVSEGGMVTIYPAFPLRDGGMGDWTIRYERRDQESRSRRARYLRDFGEGPSRIMALYDLCMKVLPMDDGETPVREMPEAEDALGEE